MTDEQADRMLDLLSGIKDEITALNERVSTMEEKFSALDDLSELARNLTRDGLFSDSFAGEIGEKFNEGLTDALEGVSEDLGAKLDEVVSKLDDVNSSIQSIDLSSD